MGLTSQVAQDSTQVLDVVRHVAEVPWTERLTEVCLTFGIRPQAGAVPVATGIPIGARPGQVTAVVGPSGAGKSRLLETVATRCPNPRRVSKTRFPRTRAVVDAVACRQPLEVALSVLTRCGLGEPRLWIRRYAELSEGERFRARLARAMSLQLRGQRRVGPLLCDEFGSILHRRAARAIAYNVGKLARREGLAVVLATSHEDILPDLQPDTVVHLDRDGGHSVSHSDVHDRPFSLGRRLRIEPGKKSDYDRFAPMHYRRRDALGFVDRVFVLRDGVGGEPLGIAIYAHAPLELALRNRATGGRFRGNPRRLNRELRILRRLVLHPDIRGCGVGHWFVRETLPRVGVAYVECLAAMGRFNPVFERGGMRRIGLCPRPRGQQRLLNWLRRQGVDPLGNDFERTVGERPEIRGVVADVVRQWYRATTAATRDRVAGQSPSVLAQTFRQLVGSRPVYYLWHREGEGFGTVASEESTVTPVAPSSSRQESES